MNEEKLRGMLAALQAGEKPLDEVVEALKELPFSELGSPPLITIEKFEAATLK